MVLRVTVAAAVGFLAALTCYAAVKATPDHLPDFGLVWFGARSLIAGQNAYELVGPALQFDWPWPLVYPASAFVAAMPLAPLPQVQASIIFVFLSFVLLGFSVTKEGWHRLPMFASMPVITSAAAGQWSPILTAAIGLPWLAFLFPAKPTDGLALLALGSRETVKYALAGAVLLGAASIALFPKWPMVWLHQLPYANVQMAPPLFRAGGFLVLLALIKWRRQDARFLVALSIIPAVGAWYTAVPLFLIPKTFKESMILSMTSSLGWLAQYQLVRASSETELNAKVGEIIVTSCFLPCVVMVLRRSNRRSSAVPSGADSGDPSRGCQENSSLS